VFDAITFVVSVGSPGERVTLIDPSGEDIGRATLPTRAAAIASGSADAGGVPLPAGPTPPLVDVAGTFAFATADGTVGVARFSIATHNRPEALAAAEPSVPPVPVDALADICPMPFGAIASSNSPPRPVTGLAALPEERLLAVCRSGAVFALTRQ
jgi:hypothetical protein